MSVYDQVSKQLQRNIETAHKFASEIKCSLNELFSLSYEDYVLKASYSIGSTIIGVFENDRKAWLCFWNLNRSNVVEGPNRVIASPSPIRSVCCHPNQPDIIFAGFSNGDVRLYANDSWSMAISGHSLSVTAVAWDPVNTQMILSASADCNLTAWRFSKSKQKIEKKSTYKVRKNYGCPKFISIELEKFLLVATDANSLIIFEFANSPIKGSDEISLQPKRIFKNSFEVPFTAPSALSLGYMAPVTTLVAREENAIFSLNGSFAHEMAQIAKFGTALKTSKNDLIVLPSTKKLHVFTAV